MATGTGNLPNQGMSFSPFAILTAEEQNDLVENIESLATGSGIGDGAVTTAKIANSAVTSSKIDLATLNFGNYSTSETNTGFTWIDGKTIYKKTYTLGAFPNNSTKNVAHGITGLNEVVKFEGYSYGGGVTYETLGQYYDTSRASVYVSGANIVMRTNFNATSLFGVVTLYYTKT